MPVSRVSIAMLATLLRSVLAIPQVSNLVTTTTSPTIIGGDKMAAASFIVDTYNQTNIVYQAADTSIQLLRGYGPPTTASTYDSVALLAAGLARNDTPLAIVSDHSVFAGAHVFYLSATECDGGNYLYELYDAPFHGWTDGSLNALQICSSGTSNLLYALGPFQCGSTAGSPGGGGPLRVGFVRASDNSLAEVYNTGSSWAVSQY